MAYKIQFTPKAAKLFSKLDQPTKKRIQALLLRLESLDNPRSVGKPLQGGLSGLWRYRVGDYRVLTQIIDERVLILVVDLDHRSTVYN